MSTQKASVPLYRPYIPGTAVQSERIGTGSGTKAGTPSLKSLSTLYLMKQKAVHPVVQPPVHQQKKCTTGAGGSGTLFEGENALVQAAEAAQKIDNQIEKGSPSDDEPTPEQLAHARRMLVDCPSTGGERHCWHCSRCDDAWTCSAWKVRRSDVKFFRQSEEPYSLSLVEGGEPEAAPVSAPDYAAFCSSYWRGCSGCPDFQAGALRFCSRYNRLHDDIVEVMQ